MRDQLGCTYLDSDSKTSPWDPQNFPFGYFNVLAAKNSLVSLNQLLGWWFQVVTLARSTRRHRWVSQTGAGVQEDPGACAVATRATGPSTGMSWLGLGSTITRTQPWIDPALSPRRTPCWWRQVRLCQAWVYRSQPAGFTAHTGLRALMMTAWCLITLLAPGSTICLDPPLLRDFKYHVILT